jgi:ATP-dependent DNA helicase RecG
MDEGISEGVKSLLDLVQETPGLHAPQLSKASGVPAKTLERWLKLLKERNRIEFRGSRRFGGYRRKELQNQETPSE